MLADMYLDQRSYEKSFKDRINQFQSLLIELVDVLASDVGSGKLKYSGLWSVVQLL